MIHPSSSRYVLRERFMSPAEAGLLSGLDVPDTAAPVLPVPGYGEPTFLIDASTGDTVAIITRLPDDRLAALRRAVSAVQMQSVARAKLVKAGRSAARTFGWAPRKPQALADSCRKASLDRDHPDSGKVLAELAGWLGREFQRLMPERAYYDRAVVGSVKDDWLLDEDALWTSGVINRSATLPYHRDGSNFHTWSAMPTLRFATRGGTLHLPEYDVCFPCRDGEVTWFCGRDLVHGVTPMHGLRADAYRYSVVYYALAGMVDCATFAEETRRGPARRTQREREIADRARQTP